MAEKRLVISTFDAELRLACERMVDVEGGIWGRLVTANEALAEFAALALRPDPA